MAVSMSAPRLRSLSTSSLSEAAQAARKTQPSVNWMRWLFRFGSVGSRHVSLSCQRFNWSALFNRADVLRVSSEVMTLKYYHSACPANRDFFFAEAQSMMASLGEEVGGRRGRATTSSFGQVLEATRSRSRWTRRITEKLTTKMILLFLHSSLVRSPRSS